MVETKTLTDEPSAVHPSASLNEERSFMALDGASTPVQEDQREIGAAGRGHLRLAWRPKRASELDGPSVEKQCFVDHDAGSDTRKKAAADVELAALAFASRRGRRFRRGSWNGHGERWRGCRRFGRFVREQEARIDDEREHEGQRLFERLTRRVGVLDVALPERGSTGIGDFDVSMPPRS